MSTENVCNDVHYCYLCGLDYLGPKGHHPGCAGMPATRRAEENTGASRSAPHGTRRRVGPGTIEVTEQSGLSR
jgi:hypothetical protein